MPPPLRRIVHVDMDAFYASVEQRDDPSLRGQPVAVGGSPDKRGVVAAASYEARVYGVRSAMSMARALRLCPHLVVVLADFSRYREASRKVFDLFRSVTPLVEPLSLDEAYLDVTDNAWHEPIATNVARRLKQRIREDTGLTASAGVAPNKFLAKIASAWQKPDGLTVIRPDRIEEFLRDLPIDALWGIGPVTARKLRAAGIEKLVDVRRVDPDALRLVVGSQTGWLRQLANGVDDRPVVPNRRSKSASTERTYAEDLVDLADMETRVSDMAREVAGWLARKARRARTVTVKVRYHDFTTVTRSLSGSLPTCDPGEIVARARLLLRRTDAARRPVRLLGVGVHGLTEAGEAVVQSPGDVRLPFPDDADEASETGVARDA